MINPLEIKKQCLSWWIEVLQSEVQERFIFPRSISRFGKLQTKDLINNLATYQAGIDQLRQNAKETIGYGYTIRWENRSFEKIGKNAIPVEIVIDTLEDYLKLTGNEKEYRKFKHHSALLLTHIPTLKDWVSVNPLKLIEFDEWAEIIKVCQYFIKNPRPNLYIRQLPIDVHTKFVQEHEALFRSQLDFLIPEHTDSREKKFEKRYHLKYSEPLIRVRYLEPSLAPFPYGDDLSMPISNFKELTPI